MSLAAHSPRDSSKGPMYAVHCEEVEQALKCQRGWTGGWVWARILPVRGFPVRRSRGVQCAACTSNAHSTALIRAIKG
eukprot:scaffold118858_cov25-Tisochrysis_lutea.AAC.1